MSAHLHALLAGGAAWLRTVRRYPFYLAGSIFWPLAIPLAYVAQAQAYPGAGATFRAHAGVASVAGFLFVGWAMYMWLSNILWGPGAALRERQVQGQLESMLLTPAARWTVIFGPAIGALGFACVQFATVAIALRGVFGIAVTPGEAARALAVIAISIPALYGMGALFSVAVLLIGEINGMVQLVRGTCTVLCGFSFPVVLLPGVARAAAEALPPTHVVSAVRATLLAGTSLAAAWPDLLVLATASIVLPVAGLACFVAAERRARATGSLGRY